MRKVFFIIATLISNVAYTQTYAYIEKDSISKVYFQLSTQKTTYNYPIYFPYSGETLGFDIAPSYQVTDDMYAFPVQNSIHVNNATQINIPVYFSKNVKSFEVTVVDETKTVYNYSQKIATEGYQTSIRANLIKTDKIANTEKRIYIRVTKKKPLEGFNLVFSDIQIADFYRQQIVSPLPLFKQLFAYNNTYGVGTLTPIFKNATVNTNWFSVEYCQSPITISTPTQSVDNKKLLYDIVRACIVEYPFFEEKKQNKDLVLSQLEQIWQQESQQPECELAESFQNLLRKSFHDGHFKIDLACKKDPKVLGPLRLSHIDGKYQVSAVLDSVLEKEIPLGSIVRHINNQDILLLTDSLVKRNYTAIYAKERQQLVLNDIARDLVAFNEGNKIQFGYTTPSGETKISDVVYRKKYTLKPIFSNIHCEYKSIDNRTAYYKVNSFDELPVLRFQSIVDSIKHKNLIIDIRGNGGGDLTYVDDFLSFFVSEQAIGLFTATSRDAKVIDSLYYINQNTHKMEATSKIVVLIDSKTSCSSEIFIKALKKYNKNMTTIGTDNTSGTLANAFYIKLPTNNFGITVNSPQVYKYTSEQILEDVGIAPDIKVNLDTVYDLKPYNDKVMQTALQFLNQKATVSNKIIFQSNK